MQIEAVRRNLIGWTAFAAVALADGAALLTLRPAAARSWRHLPHLGRWIATSGCDNVLAQLAAAALWLAAVWLALGLFSAVAAGLPGWPGRVAAAACRTVLPRAAGKLLAGTAGFGVLLAPAAALAVSSPAASATGIVAAAPHATGKSLPAPTWPTTSPTAGPTTGKPITRPTTHPRPAEPRDADAQATVRVRRGDCLWLLAARRLPPGAPDAQIAAYWPQWYAANRAIVGADPDLLQPGEVLHVPTPPRRPSTERILR